MKPRTPGFTPRRLTLAREAAGLSKVELANLVNVTAAAIGQYENGSRTPGPDVVQAISTHLGHPIPFFLRPDPPQRTGPVFYRSLQSTEKPARDMAQAKMVFLWIAVDYFRALITLPPVNLPAIGKMPSNPHHITDSMIDAVVEISRQHWSMGDQPAPNIVWLLEQSGVVVARLDLATDKLEALSEWREDEGRPYIILNSTKRNAFRSRADIAHELGHLLLHRWVTLEHLEDRTTFKKLEEQAWRFAQGFLLPEAAFLSDVYSLSLDTLRALKPKWRVSIAFMLQRIYRLDILTQDKYVNYRKYLAQRGWLRTEPYDAETLPEQPLLLAQLVDFLKEHGIHSTEQIMSGLDFNPIDLEEFMQVETGYFSLFSGNIQFTSKRRVG